MQNKIINELSFDIISFLSGMGGSNNIYQVGMARWAELGKISMKSKDQN